MCGIAGVLSRSKPVNSGLLSAMRKRIATRGPDDAGEWISEDLVVGLTHCRLSVIDLSVNGHQPMIYHDRWVISYNGELYNYKNIKNDLKKEGFVFQGESDTEVVLASYAKWGANCLKYFNGIFSFSIYDKKKKTFFLARDHQGIKPLYYHHSKDLFAFASRLTSLIVHSEISREIDEQSLSYYLECGYISNYNSILKSVKKLPAGHYLELDNNHNLSVNKYYDSQLIVTDENKRENFSKPSDWINTLNNKIYKSVKRQMVADVPVGVFLSGGIDSSLIAAMMQKDRKEPIHSFCVGFEQEGYDESLHSRQISDYLGTQHHEIHFSFNELIDLLDEYTYHYDEPFADWSALPTLAVSKFARQTVTVCLGGDGGDELFGGYKYYRYLQKLAFLFKIPVKYRAPFVSYFIQNISLPQNYRLLLGSLASSSLVECFTFMRSMIKDYPLEKLFSFSGQTKLSELFESAVKGCKSNDVIHWSGELDKKFYLVDDILQKVDVASMASSLESRVPLLDREIVEFAQMVPSEFKIKNGITKWILREVLYRHVPRELVDRPKAGFNVPIREWFRGELKELIQDELSESKIRDFGYLNQNSVKEILQFHLSGQRDTHPMLWILMSLLRWKEQINSIPVYV